MKKLYRRSACAAILVATVSAAGLALATPAGAESKTDAYSHDSSPAGENTDWMSWLPSQTRLSELTLPGTHDSGAYRTGGDVVLTQSLDLNKQLMAGIRVWDIRLGADSDGRLKIYHGPIKQGQDFENDVLGTADAFLAAHPAETVLMRIKHETGQEEGFDVLVRAGLSRYSRVYTGTSDNPTLGDIRGKIVVLQDFGAGSRVGIPWSSLAIQDQYNLRTNWDLAGKWRAIRSHLDAAQYGSRSTTYVNFLTGSGGSFPYFVASGNSSPQTGAPNLLTGMTRGVINTCGGNSQCIPEFPSVNCFLGTCSVAFEGTNILTRDEINKRPRPNRYGIIMADFPGYSLLRAVISANDYATHRGMLRVAESGRCVDVINGVPQNSNRVQMLDCVGNPHQTWSHTPYGELMIYGRMCLDVRSSGTANMTPVQIYGCNRTGAQEWVFRPDGSVFNPQSGKCLDATAHGVNGALLVIYTCHGGLNQKWSRT